MNAGAATAAGVHSQSESEDALDEFSDSEDPSFWCDAAVAVAPTLPSAAEVANSSRGIFSHRGDAALGPNSAYLALENPKEQSSIVNLVTAAKERRRGKQLKNQSWRGSRSGKRSLLQSGRTERSKRWKR